MRKFIAYTDGSSSPHSIEKKGGWGFVAFPDWHPDLIYCESGSEKETTNQRMELQAIIKACERINSLTSNEKVKLKIFSDSRYCIDGITDWIHKWKKNSWKKCGAPIKNLDLWQNLYKIVYESNINVEFIWVKGHSGNRYNDLADELATKAKKES